MPPAILDRAGWRGCGWGASATSPKMTVRSGPRRRRSPDIGASAPLFHGSGGRISATMRSEEHTSELQSLMRISYAVFCLKKKTQKIKINTNTITINHNRYYLHT